MLDCKKLFVEVGHQNIKRIDWKVTPALPFYWYIIRGLNLVDATLTSGLITIFLNTFLVPVFFYSIQEADNGVTCKSAGLFY